MITDSKSNLLKVNDFVLITRRTKRFSASDLTATFLGKISKIHESRNRNPLSIMALGQGSKNYQHILPGETTKITELEAGYYRLRGIK